jgi:pimeloyl-ACP methyl ester carboxylesterase
LQFARLEISSRQGGKILRYDDWGERTHRWAGIRSETLDVGGTSAHVLRAEASPDAPPGAPTHLLLHTTTSGATMWLDVINPLTALGPVIAPDLPGAVLGETEAPISRAGKAEPSARFIRALTSALMLDRVVLHGWSMGGLVALLYAADSPTRVSGLVLAGAPLPVPMTTVEQFGWRTLGRAGLVVGTALARVAVRIGGSRVATMKSRYTEPDRLSDRIKAAGGNPSRCSREFLALLSEQLKQLSARPGRLDAAVLAFASVLDAILVDQRPTVAAIERLAAPTLVLWGDQDPFVEQPTIDRLAELRPDWQLEEFPGVGHLLPVEVPDDYVRAVGAWLAGR